QLPAGSTKEPLQLRRQICEGPQGVNCGTSVVAGQPRFLTSVVRSSVVPSVPEPICDDRIATGRPPAWWFAGCWIAAAPPRAAAQPAWATPARRAWLAAAVPRAAVADRLRQLAVPLQLAAAAILRSQPA